jgi:CRISPR/Cas system-associated endoribonuclease Cas2
MDYFISYDLNRPGQDYSSLISALETLGAKRYQKSAWLLTTTASATEIVNALSSHIDKTDSLFVAQYATNAAWYTQGSVQSR